MKTQLAAPEQDVVAGSRPFPLAEEVDLARVETGAEVLAEIARRRSLTKQLRRVGAVGAGEASQQRCGLARISNNDLREIAVEIGVRHIASGQGGTGCPC